MKVGANLSASAARALERAGERYAARERIAAVLDEATDIPRRVEGGRVVLDTWALGGKRLDVPGARAVPAEWTSDPADWSSRLRGCSRRWAVGAEHHLRPVGCGLGSLCPSCRATRAGSRIRRGAAVLSELALNGITLALLTLTQPQGPAGAAPVVLLPRELDWWWAPTVATRRGVATTGAPLHAELDRLRSSWRMLRHDYRPGRSWWTEHVEAAWYGVEWTTGIGIEGPLLPKQRGLNLPRYHVHLHAVVALAADKGWTWREDGEVDPSCAPWLALVDLWARCSPGARPSAQDLRRVEGEDVAGAVAEVLKYPFKPTASTAAGVLDGVAVARGLHPHQVCGAWHGQSRRWRVAVAYAEGTLREEDISREDWPLVQALLAGEAHDAANDWPAWYRPGGGGPGDAWGPWREAVPAQPVTVEWLRKVKPGRLVEVATYAPRAQRWSDTVSIRADVMLEAIRDRFMSSALDASTLLE